jgi:hypothetical protein
MKLTARTVILFWLPLAATWFMMALEGPYIAAIVARMPEAARGWRRSAWRCHWRG